VTVYSGVTSDGIPLRKQSSDESNTGILTLSCVNDAHRKRIGTADAVLDKEFYK
jgi:hypothetical protein